MDSFGELLELMLKVAGVAILLGGVLIGLAIAGGIYFFAG